MKWLERPEGLFISYSRRLSVGPVPDEAQRYVVSGKSALQWIIDRYCVKTDRASGIVNDANDWIAGQGRPDALVRLIKRVAWLSAETVKIVDKLPPSMET
jgi:predicted helicase